VVARARTWTCRRWRNGHKCLHVNPSRKRKCEECGAPKPAPRRPKHMVALAVTYDDYVTLNGGERCAICLRERSAARRFDRDHDHRTGRPRGLLCPRCNRALPAWVTPEWLEAAAAYLRRAQEAA
jgi:hypothetical protein